MLALRVIRFEFCIRYDKCCASVLFDYCLPTVFLPFVEKQIFHDGFLKFNVSNLYKLYLYYYINVYKNIYILEQIQPKQDKIWFKRKRKGKYWIQFVISIGLRNDSRCICLLCLLKTLLKAELPKNIWYFCACVSVESRATSFSLYIARKRHFKITKCVLSKSFAWRNV